MTTYEPGQICKVVERKPKGVANSYKYPIWCYRVVLCRPEQAGHLSERGVVCLWVSESCTYRSNKPGSKKLEQRAEAHRVAEHYNRRIRLGLALDAPEGIVSDYEQDHATETVNA